MNNDINIDLVHGRQGQRAFGFTEESGSMKHSQWNKVRTTCLDLAIYDFMKEDIVRNVATYMYANYRILVT